MISELPFFIEGQNWRELSSAQGRNRWRFTTKGMGVTVRLDLDLSEVIEFRDQNGKLWARFDGPNFTVLPGYWWNGNSPKRHVPIFGWIGTPDCRGDKTGIGGNILASVIHDAMRQFCKTEHFPLSLLEVDGCFYELNRLSGFPLALPFYTAVRAASKVWPSGADGYSILIEP